MPAEVRMLNVLIASPGDAVPARDAIQKALHDWNGRRGDAEGVILRPRRWEADSVPILGEGDAQSVINRQLVDESDIVIAVFYHRLGSPTDRGKSGTAEEIERSVANGKTVHLYFAEKDIPYNADLEQFIALRKFRLQMGMQGLVAVFKTEDDLINAVSRAIELDVSKFKDDAKGVTTTSGSRSKGRRQISPNETNLEIKFRPAEDFPTPTHAGWVQESPHQLIVKNVGHLEVTNIRVRANLDGTTRFAVLPGIFFSIGPGKETAYPLPNETRFLGLDEPMAVIISWKRGGQLYESTFKVVLSEATN